MDAINEEVGEPDEEGSVGYEDGLDLMYEDDAKLLDDDLIYEEGVSS